MGGAFTFSTPPPYRAPPRRGGDLILLLCIVMSNRYGFSTRVGLKVLKLLKNRGFSTRIINNFADFAKTLCPIVMQQSFIGREDEISLLKKYATSDRAEFVAIYGRRRVGKTFLINNVFKTVLSFSMTGIIGGNQNAQIQAFVEAMDIYACTAEVPANWF